MAVILRHEPSIPAAWEGGVRYRDPDMVPSPYEAWFDDKVTHGGPPADPDGELMQALARATATVQAAYRDAWERGVF